MIKTSSYLTAFAIAATAVATPALAQSERAGSFEHAGTTYSYIETVNDSGSRVIAGKSSDGRAFRLIVGTRMVRGQFNGNPVLFSLNEVKPLKIALR